jgi:hypothetical protein
MGTDRTHATVSRNHYGIGKAMEGQNCDELKRNNLEKTRRNVAKHSSQAMMSVVRAIKIIEIGEWMCSSLIRLAVARESN